jgi:hypothetical protein
MFSWYPAPRNLLAFKKYKEPTKDNNQVANTTNIGGKKKQYDQKAKEGRDQTEAVH